jgi:hypothetical protein
MNLTLKFKNIQDCNGLPNIRIVINDAVVFENTVCSLIPVQCHPVDNKINLSIEHYGKDPSKDTVVVDGVIVQDRSCELDTIEVDGYDLQELKWLSAYHCDDGTVLDKCLFFGKNGAWRIAFELPVLRWILSTRHEINRNDPDWSEDYESYVRACRLLNKSI